MGLRFAALTPVRGGGGAARGEGPTAAPAGRRWPGARRPRPRRGARYVPAGHILTLGTMAPP